MTLLELSEDYLAQAQRLGDRVKALKKTYPTLSHQQRLAMAYRITTLRTMQREARDIGNLCKHYYERGYHRNGKYTL